MANKIIIAAELGSYGSRADGSMRLSFSTGIVNDDQLLVINALKNNSGFLMFKSAEVAKDEEDLIDSVDADIETKTPSQRLRGVLYRNFEQDNKGCKDFKEYYRIEMEKIITHYKQKLDYL
jgi:hypothetical protein